MAGTAIPMILVMAKAPVPGAVKTRLCPPLDLGEAADVAEAALADTLDAVAHSRAGRKVIALAGEPGSWLPAGFEVIAQRGNTFNDRLTNAWLDTGGAGIQVGMDTPQLQATELDELLARVDGQPDHALLGHAHDGGWWVIGWSGANPGAVFRDIPMSTTMTGALQDRRLRALGYVLSHARVLRDIDMASDLWHVAHSAPATRTARLARRIARSSARTWVSWPGDIIKTPDPVLRFSTDVKRVTR